MFTIQNEAPRDSPWVRLLQLTCHGPTQRLHMPWAHTTGVQYAKY